MPLSRALDPRDATLTAPSRPAATAPAAARPADLGVFANPMGPLAAVLAVAMLVVLCVSFARSAGVVAALWGAGGVAAAFWLRGGRGTAFDLTFGGTLALGILAAEFMVGNSSMLSVTLTVANMIEIVAAVVLARRFVPGLQIGSVDGLARYLLGVAVLAPLPAAAFATLALTQLNGAAPLPTFGTWWFGHALSFAVVGGFGLALSPRELVRLRKPLRMLEAAALLALIVAAAWLVFVQLHAPVSWVMYPLLILAAARFRLIGVMAGVLATAVIAIGGAMVGEGMFSRFVVDLSDRALMAQMLVLFGYLPIAMVAVLLEERDRLADRARAGQQRAERASAAKSRLLANVAHEIKSPVGGVIGIGELWRAGQLGPVTPQQEEMAAMLVKTARQVESLSHDLLDVARAESGSVKVELRPTDVVGLMEDVKRTVALRPEAAGLRFETAYEGEALVALADSQRLAQVVGNLATNAVKYGAAGGSVTFAARQVGDHVRIEVIDRSPGLSPEKQAQLFEPFNRLGLERSAVEGHGIGLALAKRLTELQGGAIGVVSEPGHGACFWVELPAA